MKPVVPHKICDTTSEGGGVLLELAISIAVLLALVNFVAVHAMKLDARLAAIVLAQEIGYKARRQCVEVMPVSNLDVGKTKTEVQLSSECLHPLLERDHLDLVLQGSEVLVSVYKLDQETRSIELVDYATSTELDLLGQSHYSEELLSDYASTLSVLSESAPIEDTTEYLTQKGNDESTTWRTLPEEIPAFDLMSDDVRMNVPMLNHTIALPASANVALNGLAQITTLSEIDIDDDSSSGGHDWDHSSSFISAFTQNDASIPVNIEPEVIHEELEEKPTAPHLLGGDLNYIIVTEVFHNSGKPLETDSKGMIHEIAIF